MEVVLKEAYSASAPDLSSLVTKLRRAKADAIVDTSGKSIAQSLKLLEQVTAVAVSADAAKRAG